MAIDTLSGKPLIHSILMTGTARNIAMFALQREGGQVVVEVCIPPTAGRMTGATIRPELSAVRISVRMTGVTICRRTLVNAVGMAGSAANVAMLSGQGEACVVMVEGRTIPTVGGVTRAAIHPELPAVRIVCSMTGIAIGRCPFENTIGMAGGTGNALMCSVQFESRRVVIEDDIVPTAWHMTGRALCAKLTAMNIVGGVAGIAIRRCPTIAIGMAGLTGNIGVLAY